VELEPNTAAFYAVLSIASTSFFAARQHDRIACGQPLLVGLAVAQRADACVLAAALPTILLPIYPKGQTALKCAFPLLFP
jgi:hypothetical protein